MGSSFADIFNSTGQLIITPPLKIVFAMQQLRDLTVNILKIFLNLTSEVFSREVLIINCPVNTLTSRCRPVGVRRISTTPDGYFIFFDPGFLLAHPLTKVNP